MKIRRIIYVISCAFVLGFSAGTTVAQEKKHCSLIEDHDKRIACHTSNPITPKRSWLVLKSNYFKSVTVSKNASYEILCGNKTGNASIIFICAKKQTSLVLTTMCPMGEKGDRHSVQFNLDDQAPSTESFIRPKNKFALSTKNTDAVARLANSMSKHKLMHVKMAPPSGEPHTATFDLTGFDNKIKPLRTACGW